MDRDITNYPLSWPFGWKRTEPHRRQESRFGSHTILESAKQLKTQIRLMDGRNVIISSNKKVKVDGIPYSGQRTPDDPGVAVYFDRKGQPKVFPCDKWRTVEENLWQRYT